MLAFFLKEDKAINDAMEKVAEWVENSDFSQRAKSEFLAGADFRLVAHARAIGSTVVTREKYEPHARKKIKIPNACRRLDVSCADPFDMLRHEGARFILE